MNKKGQLPSKNVYIAIGVVVIIAVVIGVGSYIMFTGEGPAAKQEVQLPTKVKSYLEETKNKYGDKVSEITVAYTSHPSSRAFDNMIPAFEKVTGIEVNTVMYSEMGYYNKIKLLAAGKAAPFDALYTCIETVPVTAAYEYLTPIDQYLNNEELTPDWYGYQDIVKAYRDYGKWQGTTYAIPVAGEAAIFYYRKDLFDQYNKEPPATFEELLDLCEFFKGKDEVDYPLALRMLPWQGTYLSEIAVHAYGGAFFDPETLEVMVTNEDTKKGIRVAKQLYTEYGPPGVANYTFSETWSDFRMGRAAMMIDASAAAPGIENPKKSKVVGKVGYTATPKGPAGQGVHPLGWSWSIPSYVSSDRAKVSWALITYLTSKPMQETYLESGGIVCRKSGLEQMDAPYADTILQQLKESAQSEVAQMSLREYATAKQSEISSTLGSYLGGIILQDKPMGSQLQKLSDALKPVLEKLREIR
ncbi:hypothetical protein AKJ57_05140 [candidate division MSBL1 archaeon SCGC-AAA259A05]|uniref:ABC transporter substrate-binding protein n=1 Tax=candidate division MSBL1 archaeon SCGC-AAA259A05 TaxID=1698259 RepID=A0A133U5W1_9EURY|nr:hypothetical protein AKJ57_05140 [candidate division MSBL1 archaeon SCGC-AAA259A05]